MDEETNFEVIDIEEGEVYEYITEEVINDDPVYVLCDDSEQNIKSESQIDGKFLFFFEKNLRILIEFSIF